MCECGSENQFHSSRHVSNSLKETIKKLNITRKCKKNFPSSFTLFYCSFNCSNRYKIGFKANWYFFHLPIAIGIEFWIPFFILLKQIMDILIIILKLHKSVRESNSIHGTTKVISMFSCIYSYNHHFNSKKSKKEQKIPLKKIPFLLLFSINSQWGSSRMFVYFFFIFIILRLF